MNNQEKILDEARPRPLDLGFNILTEAYKMTGRTVPDWLKDRIPENQLEETLQDAEVVVKAAFEKYIDEQYNKAIQFWRSTAAPATLILSDNISERLLELAKGNFLPHVKAGVIETKEPTIKYKVIIRRGILAELYSQGITRDQCPNLQGLAGFMKADYKTSHGYRVIFATGDQLSNYFDHVEEFDKDKEARGE